MQQVHFLIGGDYMGEGLLGFFRKYGQAGLDKLEELKLKVRVMLLRWMNILV